LTAFDRAGHFLPKIWLIFDSFLPKKNKVIFGSFSHQKNKLFLMVFWHFLLSKIKIPPKNKIGLFLEVKKSHRKMLIFGGFS
jgi:hypothetical protein